MRHPFLSDSACIHRLVDEYKKYGQLVIAYDFDNCVYDYHAKDHDYSEVIDLLRIAKTMGFYLIVFTASEDLEKVNTYLELQRIPFDAINENPPFFPIKLKKDILQHIA